MKSTNISSFPCTKPPSKHSHVSSPQRALPLAANTPKHLSSAQCVLRNVDLFMLIAENIEVTGTLLNLFEACATANQALDQMPKSMIVALLNTIPLEMHQMALAILHLESTQLTNSAERATFISTYLGHSDEPLPKLKNPVKAFTQLRDVAAAVETLTPLYVSACMENLERAEAERLASDHQCIPERYCSSIDRPTWRYDGDDAMNFAYNWERDPLADTPYPWRSPAHAIETHRIQRAFWRFDLFCRLYPETPSMSTGNDAKLNADQRNYLARLQKWECEEVASVIPFLFRILERIYDPAIFRDQTNHIKRSKLQWASFLAQAPVNEAKRYDKPSDRQNEDDWEAELTFGESAGLGPRGPKGNSLYGVAVNLGHQKWLAHQVSRGLTHILTCHQQYVHDEGKVFARHYPVQRYDPWQFYNAPVEALLRWWYRPCGSLPSDDYDLDRDTTKHVRQWEDLPEANSPSRCWSLIGYGIQMYHSLNLRDVGFVFWDSRDKEASTLDHESKKL